MDYSKIKKVHIIGIEGGGTSALACMYKDMGLEVTGSDEGDHFFQDILLSKGIKLFDKFDPNNIPNDADLVVYSSAFKPETNSELASASNPVSYAEALAGLFNQKNGIAVAGSHGKTTITAWLGYVMEQAGLKPSMIVGAKVPQLNGSSLAGKSDYFLIEADEYQNKLKYYEPNMVLLSNVDYDHPDFFESQDDYINVFIEFIKKIPASGWLAANYDDDTIINISKTNCKAKIIGYGIDNEKVNYLAKDISYNNHEQSFSVNDLGRFKIKLLGKHNVSNALAVIAACLELGIDLEVIKKYLAEFAGTVRRLQQLGKYNNVPVLDDFAHHPTEIMATLDTVRQIYPDNRLVVVFHPHTFTRTKALFNDFLNSFDLVDELIILDIYGSAREERGGVSSQDLVEKIKLIYPKKEIKHLPSLFDAEQYLKHNLRDNDVLLLIGAGDVFKIGENLIK
ncbi:MAG: UDP-N-acetylmuramate--L-alanine ligase [bacterium]